MLFAELEQIGEAGHGAILVENLADDSGGVESGETGQIDAGLGVACAPENASFGTLQGEDMARLTEIARVGLGAGQNLDRGGSVLGADAGGRAVGGVDRDGEVGGVEFAVVGDHPLEAEMLGPLLGHRNADQATAILRHEVHRMGGHFGGGHDEVSLVLPILVIGDDHHSAPADLLDDFRDGIK